MASTEERATRARAVCGECRHAWAEHPGALHAASVVGACARCVLDVEHGDRPVACEVHAPSAVAAAAPRVDFAVTLGPASRAAGLGTLLDAVRPDAVAVAFDLPEDEARSWTAEASAASAVLRAAAGLPADTRYRTVDWLPVDDAVWAAFRAVVPHVYTADVWGARGVGDSLLEANDEGTSVVARLGPDQYAAALHRLPADALTVLPRRATLLRRVATWRPGRRDPRPARDAG
ncbi:hypothetical protein ACFO3K_11585 [Cellulomonas algicola]|uniref:hypothetical protein n=1 Tax=Cellulomonas algicola TaxID=2071633 RepID=UPI001C3FC798|nr:hypothetical protein [Cellulomonas algicola]